MKKLFLSALASMIVVSLYAQDSSAVTQPVMRNRKNAKKDRINNLMRMEEEGDLIFNKHNIFGIKLATDGYGISFEKGKYKTPSRTLIFQFELNEKKSPKEHKVTASSDFYSYSSVVLEKMNNFYEFKMAVGQQHLIGGKGNKNGVAVTALYSGGLTLGLLKPYYIQAGEQNQDTRRMTWEQFYADTSGKLLVSGASGFTVGWDHLSVKPGVNAKAAMRFDYGRLNQTITAIEAGVTGEYFSGKIPQVLFVPQKQFFFNAYVTILFGSRK